LDPSKHRVIAISIENYKKLQRMGLVGQSFNDQLDKLFEAYNIPEKDRENTAFMITDKEEDKQ
jgi:predicted CopG family antitoxin